MSESVCEELVLLRRADRDADCARRAEAREGIIVRPLAGFGSPTAIRVSVGTPEELDEFAAALGRVLARA
jgi:histidinol-phosphate aminotransferase